MIVTKNTYSINFEQTKRYWLAHCLTARNHQELFGKSQTQIFLILSIFLFFLLQYLKHYKRV